MGSAIILARKYWNVSGFEHYFRPVFEDFGITVDAFHGFNDGHEDQILFALRGNKLETEIYEAIESAVSTILIDEKVNMEKWKLDRYNIPDWRIQFPNLMDRTPEFIGRYKEDNTASELFSSTALGYIARASENSVVELVENSTNELRALGESLSGL